MASYQDASVISNVIFFHATLAPLDGLLYVGDYIMLISIKEGDEIYGLRYFSMNMYGPYRWPFLWHMRGHDELCAAIVYESWWLFSSPKKLRCRPCYKKKRTMPAVVVQGLKWPLGLRSSTWTLRFSRKKKKKMMLLTLSNFKSDNWWMHLVRIIKNQHR